MGWADAPRMQKPYYNDLLEVRIQYYRESDRNVFRGRGFFFRTPTGEWARENLSSFPKQVLRAAVESPFFLSKPGFELDADTQSAWYRPEQSLDVTEK